MSEKKIASVLFNFNKLQVIQTIHKQFKYNIWWKCASFSKNRNGFIYLDESN